MNQSYLGTHGIGGMDISGVIYTYNPIKLLEDDFVVTVENDRVGGGFVFQDTEDWSGKYPIRIKKVIPLAYTPIAVFGDGRIRTSGTGTIEDASVQYIYRFDACLTRRATLTVRDIKNLHLLNFLTSLIMMPCKTSQLN